MTRSSNRRKLWAELDSAKQTQIILFWLILIALVMGVVSSYEDGQFAWRDLGGNLATELFGGAITFVVIDRVIGGRREREEAEQAVENRRQSLIRQMGSRVHIEASRAVEELRSEGWLVDGSLQGANLYNASLAGASLVKADLHDTVLANAELDEANLSYADLSQASLKNASLSGAKLNGANMEGAHLQSATLEGASLRLTRLNHAELRQANLQNASLWGAQITDASLRGANLAGANLEKANLANSSLWNADLQGASLRFVNLRGVSLNEVSFDENTVLPDGQKWSSEQDMSRFTDPSHAHFWRGFDLTEKDLSGIDLSGANLHGADLHYVNFTDANLENADLRDAMTREATMHGANLRGANLLGADIRTTRFDDRTIFPDGTTRNHNTEFKRFSDPRREDFWRSDDPDSPAYKGHPL